MDDFVLKFYLLPLKTKIDIANSLGVDVLKVYENTDDVIESLGYTPKQLLSMASEGGYYDINDQYFMVDEDIDTFDPDEIEGVLDDNAEMIIEHIIERKPKSDIKFIKEVIKCLS